MSITTIDEEIREVDRARNTAHHGAAQAKVLAMRLRAGGDLHGASIAFQIAAKLDACVEQFSYISGDLAYRKQQLIALSADRIDAAFVSQFADEEDFRDSQADAHMMGADR
jgi:hypothetical protein